MIKQLLLIAAMLPTTVTAHDWNQDYWLERLLRNHEKIVDCYITIVEEEDTATFREHCSLHSMGYTENSVLAEYYAEKLMHPTMTNIEFIRHHFLELPESEIAGVWGNVKFVQPSIRGAIISMYIVEGLTRDDK